MARWLSRVRFRLGSALKGPVRRLFRWTFLAYLFLCGGLVLLEAVFGMMTLGKMAAHPGGTAAVLRTCNQCHGYFRVFNYNLTRSVWEITVDRMIRHASHHNESSAEAPPYRFPVERRREIVDFLCAVRSYSDRRLLWSKCYRCHIGEGISDPPRHAGEWKQAVDRIQRKMPFYITRRQAEQLAAALGSRASWTIPDPPAGSGASRQLDSKLLFEEKCGVCHTLDVVLLPHIRAQDWPAILTRMGEKEPDYLSAAEAGALAPVVAEARSLGPEFSSSFPHGSMRESGHE